MTISTHSNNNTCPLCFSGETYEFYLQENTPVHSNTIYNAPEKATNCQRGNISLTICHNCNLIFNSHFNNKLLKYHTNYDNNQMYSSYYRNYINSLIQTLKAEVEIEGKRILEIGSGSGEFLRMICKESHSLGIGIDPAYRGEKQIENVTFISDYFNEQHYGINADIVILRHLLEHLSNPSQFLASVLQNIHTNTGQLTTILEVPSFEWIIAQGAYWDITYEHCNYFTREALRNLLELNNASTTTILNMFSNQYLVAIGKLNTLEKTQSYKTDLTNTDKVVNDFIATVAKKKEEVNSIVNKIEGSFTIWGVASKGVNFINSLGEEAQSRIPFVIDINKRKQGKYCPGSGHRIASPSALEQEKSLCDIIVMNPNYYNEIAQSLQGYDREFRLITV